MKSSLAIKDHGDVSVYEYGTGDRLIVMFLGFGYGPERIGGMLRKLGQNYTVRVIELPFHAGKWKRSRFGPADLRLAVELLLSERKWTVFHVLGHSLGGRVWLKVLPLLQRQPDSVTLVAPDGLGGNYTDWLDRLPGFTIQGLSKLLDKPGGIFRLADFLRRRGLVNAFGTQYLQYHLGDPFYKNRLVGTMRSVPGFRIGKQEMAHLATLPNVLVMMGRGDGIINIDNIKKLFAQVPNAELRTVPGGHAIPESKVIDHFERLAAATKS